MSDEVAEVSVAGTLSETSREMYWSELPDCPKCDRVRRVVKRMENQVHELRVKMIRMELHQHSVGGDALVPPDEAEMPRSPRASRGDDVVF